MPDLTEEEDARIPQIMETLAPKEWLESQPAFSEAELTLAMRARQLFFEAQKKTKSPFLPRRG